MPAFFFHHTHCFSPIMMSVIPPTLFLVSTGA